MRRFASRSAHQSRVVEGGVQPQRPASQGRPAAVGTEASQGRPAALGTEASTQGVVRVLSTQWTWNTIWIVGPFDHRVWENNFPHHPKETWATYENWSKPSGPEIQGC